MDNLTYIPLNEVLINIQNGYSGKQNNKKIGVPISRIETLQNNSLDAHRIKYAQLNEIEKEKYQYKNGDIIFSHINSFEKLGKVAIYNGQIDPLYHGVNILRLTFKKEINPKYAYYYFLSNICRSFYEQHIKKAINQASLNQKNLKSIPFPKGTLEFQTTLVLKLDEIFRKINIAETLTNKEIRNTSALKESFLDSLFEEMSNQFDDVPLLRHVKFIGGSQPPKSQFSSEPKEGYVRLIQIRDYKSDNYKVYIDPKITKKFCEKDDVMIGRYGPPVFQILRGLEGAYNVALMKAIPEENVITKDYLYYFLMNGKIQNYIISISQRAAGQSGVNKKALEGYKIAIPPIAVQKEIVKKINNGLSLIENIEKELSSKLDHLSELKSSLLDKAFKGEL